MTRATLSALVVAASLLAGCAAQDDGATPTPGTSATAATPTGGTAATPNPATPTPPTTGSVDADADALYARAVDQAPASFGMDLSAVRDGTTLLSMQGAFDEPADRSRVTMRADPSLFEGEEMMGAETFASGVSWYVQGEAALFLVNETAFVFVGDSPATPNPADSPFGQFGDPEWVTESFGADDVEILSARETTHKGRPASEMDVRIAQEDEEPAPGKVVVYRDPARLARVEMDTPADARDDGGEPDPLAGSRMTVDFLYDDEVELAFPDEIARAFGLAHTGADPFGAPSGGEGPYRETWNFTGDAGVPLVEVEVQVKDESASAGDPGSYAGIPTLWSMKLSDGSRAQDGVALTFHDADASGTVSPGDSLEIVADDGARPSLVLRDTETGLHVVPGVGAWALLALLGACALAWRRR